MEKAEDSSEYEKLSILQCKKISKTPAAYKALITTTSYSYSCLGNKKENLAVFNLADFRN